MPYHAERALQKQVVKLLRLVGYKVYVFSRVKTAKGNPGLPDLFVRHPEKRRSAWVEVKTPHGRLSPEQEAFRDETLRVGELHYVVRSVEDVGQLG